MTDDQRRVPIGMRSAGRGWTRASAPSGASLRVEMPSEPADLLGCLPHPKAHPSFEERAAIWSDHRAGIISLAEAMRRSALVGNPQNTPARTPPKPKAARLRHTRAAPAESRQYAGEMATTAARDDRLTPNAKAFLQILRARCGKGRETIITKGTMGSVMSRSTRTIRRYLVDLVRHGYIELATRADRRGMHLGLAVRLTAKVLPFFEEPRGLARWLAETPQAAFQPFSGAVIPGKQGVTLLPPINHPRNILSSAKAGFVLRKRGGDFLSVPSG